MFVQQRIELITVGTSELTRVILSFYFTTTEGVVFHTLVTWFSIFIP